MYNVRCMMYNVVGDRVIGEAKGQPGVIGVEQTYIDGLLSAAT